jgi:hypothetical protein
MNFPEGLNDVSWWVIWIMVGVRIRRGFFVGEYFLVHPGCGRDTALRGYVNGRKVGGGVQVCSHAGVGGV